VKSDSKRQKFSRKDAKLAKKGHVFKLVFNDFLCELCAFARDAFAFDLTETNYTNDH
jgi:hypothetical protein